MMLLHGGLFASLLLLVHARPELDDQWEQFKIKYEKQYEQGLESIRRAAWEDNYDFMERHNAAYEAGYESYSVGENQFNDLTNEEFVSMLNGLNSTHVSTTTTNDIFVPQKKNAPSKVDW